MTRALRRKQVPAPDRAALLAWYDRNARVLPWRARPGESPDPYRVWLSEIMLQQTTVKAVIPYYEAFLARWPDVGALASAPLDDVLRNWAGLGYYARARNLHACAAHVHAHHQGRFPAAEEALRRLPGVGAYTAAAIAAIAFGARATPVDGNVIRVIARLFAVEEALPAARARIQALAEALTPDRRAGDFAQAMMDLGATICTPKRPACALCPWHDGCAARRARMQEEFPRKAARKAGPVRRGIAFWLTRVDGAVLVRTRPPRGLLGGMTEIPTSAWLVAFDEAAALREAPQLPARKGARRAQLAWERLPGSVSHVFTHFRLELAVYAAAAGANPPAPAGTRWLPAGGLAAEAFPSLMRKLIAHAQAARERGRGGCPADTLVV